MRRSRVPAHLQASLLLAAPGPLSMRAIKPVIASTRLLEAAEPFLHRPVSDPTERAFRGVAPYLLGCGIRRLSLPLPICTGFWTRSVARSGRVPRNALFRGGNAVARLAASLRRRGQRTLIPGSQCRVGPVLPRHRRAAAEPRGNYQESGVSLAARCGWLDRSCAPAPERSCALPLVGLRGSLSTRRCSPPRCQFCAQTRRYCRPPLRGSGASVPNAFSSLLVDEVRCLMVQRRSVALYAARRGVRGCFRSWDVGGAGPQRSFALRPRLGASQLLFSCSSSLSASSAAMSLGHPYAAATAASRASCAFASHCGRSL